MNDSSNHQGQASTTTLMRVNDYLAFALNPSRTTTPLAKNSPYFMAGYFQAMKAGHFYGLIVTTATWVAYNDWGGSNAYEGIDRRLPIIPTHVPRWSKGFTQVT